MKVLVYGWYGKGNLGDDLFVDAFKHIFPEYNFTFTDHIKLSQLDDMGAVFFGGGSFIGEPLKITPEALEVVKNKNIFYIGVGSETSIHESHQQLIALAKLVAIRSNSQVDVIKKLNSNVIIIPDIVYSLPTNPNSEKISRSILFIPNISVVPKWDSPHWKHAAWDYFKIELAQALDVLSKEKYQIKFLPFCINKKLNDSYAAGEIINRMCDSVDNMILEQPKDLVSTINLMSKYQISITQRFHGTVLSEMSKTPCLTIHHHDKLKNSAGSKISYYESNKNRLLEEIKLVLDRKVDLVLPIDRDIFISLRGQVENEICRGQK